jgi:hypothetical protein
LDTWYVSDWILKIFGRSIESFPLVATAFELVLLGLVLYKTFHSMAVRVKLQSGVSLTQTLIQDNILYFFGYGSFFSPSSLGGLTQLAIQRHFCLDFQQRHG